MDTDIVYYKPSIPRVLISQILQPFWKNVIYSRISPLIYSKDYEFNIESQDEIITKTLRGGICGSDLHLISLDLALNVSPTIVPSPEPRYMGHESVSEIIEIGNVFKRIGCITKFIEFFIKNHSWILRILGLVIGVDATSRQECSRT